MATGRPCASRPGGSGKGCAVPAWRRRATRAFTAASRRSSRPAPRGAAVEEGGGISGGDEHGAAQGEPRRVAPRGDLLRQRHRLFAVQPPEGEFGMHLVDAVDEAGIRRSSASISRIFGNRKKACFDTLRGGSDVASAMRQASP
jgi:hypothetical protein